MKKRTKASGKENTAQTNYKDAWFAFPEGQFRVLGINEEPAAAYEEPKRISQEPVLPSRTVEEADDTYEMLHGILQDAYTLLKSSNEAYADIIDWMIHDLNLLKTKKGYK